MRKINLALFIAACVVHAACVSVTALDVTGFSSQRHLHNLVWHAAPYFVGIPATIAAILLGFVVVVEASGAGRIWLKSAVTLLVLDPFAWWTIFEPTALRTLCIGRGCYGREATDYLRTVLVDLGQAQIAMAVVACFALVCALHATTKVQEPALAA